MSDDSVSRRRFLQGSAAALTLPALSLETGAEAAQAQTTAAGYMLRRLRSEGVDTLFGVPGATCDPLFAAAEELRMNVVVTSSDLEAGYAADGYARMKGLSAVAVTYGVGMMNLISVIAGAYAERSPVVVLNGGPTPEDERLQNELGTLATHSFGRSKSDLALFREVAAHAVRIEHAADVPRLVDAAVTAALRDQRPAYLELARNLWTAPCPAPEGKLDARPPASGEEEALAAQIVERLRKASRPALLLGIEAQRYGLVRELTALVEKLRLPWATTLLAKSVIPERTDGFHGVYGGDHALPVVRRAMEEADAVLALGCVMGRQYRHLVTGSTGLINVANGQARLPGRPVRKAELRALLAALLRQPWDARPAKPLFTGYAFEERRAALGFTPAAVPERGLTYDAVLGEVSAALDDATVAITDTSLSMYPAAELDVRGANGFVCNAIWQSIGYSVAASVGVALAQKRRALVVCGDGGFQMTAQSLSTLARRKLPVTVVVLDNGEYGIEQWILDPGFFSDARRAARPYLELHRWDYVALAKALGFSAAVAVDSRAALREALAAAKRAGGPAFISATLGPRELPAQLRRNAT